MRVNEKSKKQNRKLWLLLFCCLVFLAYTFPIIFPIEKNIDCTPIIIDSVDRNELIDAFLLIKDSVVKNGNAIVYVGGNGGALVDAIMFFDFMRSSGVWKHTTFISTGQICSASNIVWLAAKLRIVTPGSSFLIHKAKWNMKKEDEQTKMMDKFNIAKNTNTAVFVATGNPEAADLWTDILVGNKDGVVIDAKTALELGWATGMAEY